MQKRKKCPFKFNWVKFHVGVQGKELADVEVKSGTEKAEVDSDHGIPVSMIKHMLKQEILQQWQSRWDAGKLGRTTYAIFPKVSIKRSVDF